ncbi:plant virulence effector HPE1-like domain-containing protein [Rhizobium paknamense]|uniref:Lipoprotein n=1 Tax=Rhizobium paknamense TaxID=1206817 RepID=A0ABU0IC45_9HYPH|nr:plant virulence effector HPE1-like domain-containing protein [Rhizobium paknamense]MDQ0455030.1 hypothetical protein [Rhizobium paknamense]
MRSVILAVAMVSALPLAAAAGSIDVISAPRVTANSILSVTCAQCPAPQQKPKREEAAAPQLAPGTQTLEFREIHGEKKLVRTEAWLGGSPVMFVSKADQWMATPSMLASTPPVAAIDGATTTAALSPAFSPESLALRLN